MSFGRSIIPLPIFLLSGCNPWLASHGTRIVEKAQNPAKPTRTGSPLTGPSASPMPGHAASPSPLPRSDLPDPNAPLDLSQETGDKELKITFLTELTVPVPSSKETSYSIYFQQGPAPSAPPAPVPHLYCQFEITRNDSTDSEVTIPAGTKYFFFKSSSRYTDENIEVITFTGASGPAGRNINIEEIKCFGPGIPDFLDFTRALNENPTKPVIDVRLEPAPKPTHHAACNGSGGANGARRSLAGQSASKKDTENDDEEFAIDDPRELEEIARAKLNQARPNFGVQFSGAYNALGNGGLNSPFTQSTNSQGFLFEGEYQPVILQKFGVIGLGPSVGIYPTNGLNPITGLPITPSGLAVWEVGAQLRYQFRYWDQQLLVPFVTYEVQRLQYSLITGPSGGLMIAGGSIGLSVLLNRIAPSEALDFYRGFGVSRSYFFLEVVDLAGSDSNVSISGGSLFLGVRCEF